MTAHSPALPERTLSFAFYVDNRKIEWPWSTINGAQVRGMVPDMNPVYRLVLEGVGREDDRPLNDGDSYPLAAPDRGPLRFYSVPPATFGCPAALPERIPADPTKMLSDWDLIVAYGNESYACNVATTPTREGHARNARLFEGELLKRLESRRDDALSWRRTAEKLTRERDDANAELNETYSDERGTVWRRPTAWAYAKACAALEDKRAALSRAEADGERLDWLADNNVIDFVSATRDVWRFGLPRVEGDDLRAAIDAARSSAVRPPTAELHCDACDEAMVRSGADDWFHCPKCSYAVRPLSEGNHA